MKVYTYSQARQNLAKVLSESRSEDVLIRRRGGELFRVCAETSPGSPFDVQGIQTGVTTKEIVQAVRKVRSR
jgi:hypothetical protein